MAVHLVSSIDTPDFGSVLVRVGDLNGDGAPDLLFAQSDYGPRTIQCLTATTIYGQRLWQTGVPSKENGGSYGDLAGQIYDWDGDGSNEVLYVKQATYAEPIEYRQGKHMIRQHAKRYEGHATLVVLDGMTGKEKHTMPLPAPADDSIAFADLTGRGRREDLVVKDGYWNIWGIAKEGHVLWHWQGSTGHYPAIADVDGDGRDEVYVGYTLLDHDGKVMFDHHDGSPPDAWGTPAHSDANVAVQLPSGEWRLLFGNGGAHCHTVDGSEVWHRKMKEAQHVVVGKFTHATAMQAAVIDRGYPRDTTGASTVYLFDLQTGEEIWRRQQPPGGWAANGQDIRWTGRPGLQDLIIAGRGPGQPAVIYDGEGNIVDELEIPDQYCGSYDAGELGGVNTGIHYCYRADVYGDSRDEVLVVGWKGVRIYANARALQAPTQYNATLYRGM